jgi:hypothetical protein
VSSRARAAVLPLALGAIGALGALPLAGGAPRPVALLSWLALWSPAAGCAYGASSPLRPRALAVPIAWGIVLAALGARAAEELPAPAWAACAWTALYALGAALGRAFARGAPAAAAAGATLLAASALALLPALGPPWPPAVAAKLIDLSPVAFVAECASLDWMRHPSLYDAARTADIDPTVRGAWRGALAAPAALVVGCALALAAELTARRRAADRAT